MRSLSFANHQRTRDDEGEGELDAERFPSQAGTRISFRKGRPTATKSLVVYSGSERYPLGPGIEAIGVRDTAQLILDLA